MSKLPHHALRFVGGALVVFAGMGLWFNTVSFSDASPSDPSLPCFWLAFYTMSAICLACYLTLLVIGVQFIRLDSSRLGLFVRVMRFEIAYFFCVFFVAMTPKIGMSVTAAMGAANGGLMFQFIVVFPLWGPLLVRWAKQGIETSPSDSDALFIASEQVDRPSDWAWGAIRFVIFFGIICALFSRVPSVGMSPWEGFGSIFLLVFLLAQDTLAAVKRRRRRRPEKIERRHASRLEAGLCPRCEYPLRGLTETRCPECGAGFQCRS